MTEFVSLMFKPFLACMILVGIHVYLGLHVIEREIIFVDLALAQIAALGATIGVVFGWALHSTQSYVFALGFTFIGAVLFAITRFRQPRVPHEAIIGIVYAVAASAVILVLSRAPEGGEELKALLVGHLLFVDWPELMKMAAVYSLIGLVHFISRKPLLLISKDPQRAFEQGLPVRWWDLLFYVTFGFVVTSSVELAGVLLVFSFLIVPALCGVLLAQSIGARLAVGWVVGTLTSVVGVAASYYWDLPTGATVVCMFGLALLIGGCASALRRKDAARAGS